MPNLITAAVEWAAAQDAERRRKALSMYGQLLARNDAPHPGDEKSLTEVMETLGRKPEHLAADLALIRRIDECKVVGPQEQRLTDEWQAAHKLWSAATQGAEAERAELEARTEKTVGAALAAKSDAELAAKAAKRAANELPALEARWNELAECANGAAGPGRKVEAPT